MSFSNDEEGDGLAALFGGVTPQGDPGPRRAAHASAAPDLAVPDATAPDPVAPDSAPPAPAAPPPYAPPAPAPFTYAPPAPAPSTYAPPSYAPPSYEMPAPAPLAPPSYDLPPPAVAPSASPYAGLVPPTPADPPTAQYPAGLDPTPSYAPPQQPAYEPPSYAPPQQPAYEPPASAPPQQPAYEPPASAPPQQPAYEPPASAPPSFDPPAYARSSYPPPVYDPPATAAPAYPPPAEPANFVVPPPAVVPPPVAAPPPADDWSTGPPVLAEPPRVAEPAESPYPQHPLARSEPAVPATVFPPGPLLPSSTAAVETPEDLERSTLGEKVGLVLAVLTGPIGLVIAIGNAVRGSRRRGWLIGVVRASLVLGVLSTIAAGIGGYVLWNIRADQIQHAEIAAASADFCAAAEADPTMVAPPTLGWPAQGASVGESLTLMQAWTDRWTTLAASSPEKLSAGMELLAEKGQTIIDAVTQSRIVDDAANQAQIASAEAPSGVANWHTTYCLEP